MFVTPPKLSDTLSNTQNALSYVAPIWIIAVAMIPSSLRPFGSVSQKRVLIYLEFVCLNTQFFPTNDDGVADKKATDKNLGL